MLHDFNKLMSPLFGILLTHLLAYSSSYISAHSFKAVTRSFHPRLSYYAVAACSSGDGYSSRTCNVIYVYCSTGMNTDKRQVSYCYRYLYAEIFIIYNVLFLFYINTLAN